MGIEEFVARWKDVRLDGPDLRQRHFVELCDALGVPRPAPAGSGADYRLGRAEGSPADGPDALVAWWLGRFAWTHGGDHPSLAHAVNGLRAHAAALGNPPLVAAADGTRGCVVTAVHGYIQVRFDFDLARPPREPSATEQLADLRALWLDPERLTGDLTPQPRNADGTFWTDGMRVTGVAWTGRACRVELNDVIVTCFPKVEVRRVAADPATALTVSPVSHSPRPVRLRVRDDVPLGTEAAIVIFCHPGGRGAGGVLHAHPTVVGG